MVIAYLLVLFNAVYNFHRTRRITLEIIFWSRGPLTAYSKKKIQFWYSKSVYKNIHIIFRLSINHLRCIIYRYSNNNNKKILRFYIYIIILWWYSNCFFYFFFFIRVRIIYYKPEERMRECKYIYLGRQKRSKNIYIYKK